MGFCLIADIEKFLQITIASAKASAAQRAIDEATAAIQNYCRQRLELVEDDEVTLDSPGAYTLNLPEMPVVEVSEVVEDSETLTEGDDYVLLSSGILRRLDQRWSRGYQIVTVTYTHGYRLPSDFSSVVGDPLPEDIVGVCVRAAARSYQAGLRAEEQGGIPGVRSTSLGDYSVAFGEDSGAGGESALGASSAPILLRSEQRILDRYRI